METKSIRFLFDGGAGLNIEEMPLEAANAARDAFARYMDGGGSHVITLLVPGPAGQDEFIVDLRKVVALHVAEDGEKP